MVSKDGKNNFAFLKEKILSRKGKDYWQSVDEFVDTPEFEDMVKGEFPLQAEEWDDSVSRRNFIKVMGASLAFAGLSGCVIQPAENVVPYVSQPEGYTPGKSMYFATAMPLGGTATGLLARSNDFRPTKIEGNPAHPQSLGATDTLAQASLLQMYDPDRSQEITFRAEPKTWQDFSKAFRAQLEEHRKNGGSGVRILSETISSPALAAQMKQVMAELPNAKWYQYEPLNCDNAMAGAKMAFGSAVNTIYKFEKAERILSLDADIFSSFNVRNIKDFSKGRSYTHDKPEMNRLYAIETTLSLTGAKADHRLGVRPSEMGEIVKAIAKACGVSGASSSYSNKWIDEMAKDLLAHRGKSLVIAGDNQSPMIHALTHAINDALGNAGNTVTYTEPLTPNADTLQADGIKELIKDIDGGAVKMLLIMGGNPLYNTPADAKLTAERLEKIPMRIHHGLYRDETAEYCQWHVADKHFLETWSDARAFDGTATIIQPLTKPLYDGKSAHEITQLFLKENFEKPELDIIRDFWKANGLADEKAWKKALHDGIIAGTALPAKSVKAGNGFLAQPEAKPQSFGKYEISILPDPGVYDGRFANNGWLQELPNPITKITWDNVALISPKTAAELGVNQSRDASEQGGAGQGTAFYDTKGGNFFSDLVKIKYQGAEIPQNVPIWIQPGQPDGVITLSLGYGRKFGRVASDLGYNVYEVRKSDSMYFGSGDITKVNETKVVASTQTHFNMESDERAKEVLRVFDKDDFEKNQKVYHQHDEYDKSMYPREFKYEGQKWGMTIDLNSCVGCNACVVACQSENNIPVVGKDQVERSREMHWIRIDAYYSGGDVNNPDDLNFQPMICQQCEQAPCEVVCPVHATVHSAEGLNDMVYNRCVGTRYCSNNCPYKVRRFNFLLYQDWNTPQYKLMRNPEVSIRSHGVMEKCTYCTQRISAARIESQRDAREIMDGEIKTACQQVCPSNAITFGDLNNKTHKVAALREDHRNYNVLNSLNTQPRTTYLASLRNQNKEMPDYKESKVIEAYKQEEKKARSEEHKEGAGPKKEAAAH